MEKKNINLELFCVTNKRLNFFENSNLKLAWVGQEVPPNGYLTCDKDQNIFIQLPLNKIYKYLNFFFHDFITF